MDIKILTKLLELSDVFLLNIQKLSNKKNYKEQEKKNIRLFRDLMKIAIPPAISTIINSNENKDILADNALRVNMKKAGTIRRRRSKNTRRKSIF